MSLDWVNRYRIIESIAEGGFAQVFKCEDTADNNSNVAVKLIPFDYKGNGIPSSVLREIAALKELEHDNVVSLLNVEHTENAFHLVFEYIDYDLSRYIKDESKALDPYVIKSFLYQILRGLSHCHSLKFLHRDLKPQNLLIDPKDNTVKLADFGFARTFDVPLAQYSTDVTTFPYKAPELLLGYPYSAAVDIWAVGCIFAEMVNRKPLFTGTTESIIMTKIIRMFGLPAEEHWPGISASCLNVCETDSLNSKPTHPLEDVVRGLDPEGFDLLSGMLCMIPSRRISTYGALKHPYLKDFNQEG